MKKGSLKGLIFLQLKNGEFSGYDLMEYVKLQTGKKPSAGSMYPILKELTDEGLIKYKEIGRKKVYSLTAKGKKDVESVMEGKKEIILKEITLMEKVSNLTCKDDKLEILKDSYDLMKKCPMEIFKVHEYVFKIKKTLVSLIKARKLEKNKDEVIKIIDDAVKKLERIKKRK